MFSALLRALRNNLIAFDFKRFQGTDTSNLGRMRESAEIFSGKKEDTPKFITQRIAQRALKFKKLSDLCAKLRVLCGKTQKRRQALIATSVQS